MGIELVRPIGRDHDLSGPIMRPPDRLERQRPWCPAVQRTRRHRRREDSADARRFLQDVAPIPEAEFWNRQRVWTTWIPVLFSQDTLWMVITLLAVLAILRRRKRNAEMRKRWEQEEDS